MGGFNEPMIGVLEEGVVYLFLDMRKRLADFTVHLECRDAPRSRTGAFLQGCGVAATRLDPRPAFGEFGSMFESLCHEGDTVPSGRF